MKKPSKKMMTRLAVIGSTAMFSAGVMAALGQQNPPPGPGMVPDYFGVVPNYANSPQPILATVTITDPGSTDPAACTSDGVTATVGGTGAIAAATTYDYTNWVQTDGVADVQILNGGSGYSPCTTVTINGGPLVSTPAAVTPTISGGVITGFTIANAGVGYSKAPIAGTGLRKFVDPLAIPPIAVPDKTTFPGSDYYEIAETEYTQQLHSDLPPTRLRGYKQLNAPAGDPAGTNQYLGPIIVADRDRPVRIKLVNQLPTGAAGNLPVPVDKTYMGANDSDNRTSMHLHGGNTPWISDGTPRQWVKPAGEAGANRGESARDVPDMFFINGSVVPACSTTVTTNCSAPAGQPQTNLPAGATNSPGDGALTFYYSNQQSQRLMFYHDHAEGITRLNVYNGLAAPYILKDQAAQDLIDGTNLTGANPASKQVIPFDQIPLVIQEKTFVPDNKTPILNFYGPFASQLASQDPTWRWGTGTAAPGLNGNGDLWVPHVFMPNQNPGDATGANAMGRWDYGPWFWPPFVGIQKGPVLNPYYDPNCASPDYCEGQFIPGVPNGNTYTTANLPAGYDPALPTLGQPSGTPEAFNDTPLVNGTVYPYINVEPKKYRLRILSVGNDRHFNLSLVVAASKNSNTTADANAAPSTNVVDLCDGTTAVAPADCTEIKMLPWNAAQDKVSAFPAWWYTALKGGVTFDGRPSGVFDPATRGPAMVQIGTEGGFLASPATIKNQPVNFEYNVKNIQVGNVKEHALLLGPAERADVIVDFSQFAGSTLLMHNDAPAALPAADLRLDYYTGDLDNTDTGGAQSTLPGYGPNTHTLMQFRVAATCTSANCGTGINRAPSTSHPVDDLDTAHLADLTTAVRSAFKVSQEPIIVPQAAYNAAYGTTVADATGVSLSTITSNALSYKPLVLDPLGIPTGALNPAAVTVNFNPKAIIEDWTVTDGRMTALLGVEMPHTTAINQTSIPQGFIDPPTELVKFSPNNATPIGTLSDGTQIWKITHNGVDTHPIHFHLFHVQIVNRVGWDGAIYPPEPNELGWKDIVRMSPLTDVIVALRPKHITNLPFKVANSHRVMDPTHTMDSNPGVFFNLDPTTGVASNVSNKAANFGWEYMWHCHILGHEENDMMRAISVAHTPETPTAISATGTGTSVTVNWTDNSMTSNWVTIQRANDPTFSTGVVSYNMLEPECDNQAGCALSYVDTRAPNGATVYYRVMSNNTVGAGNVNRTLPITLASLTPNFRGFDNVTSSSEWSNTVSRVGPSTPQPPVAPTNVSIERLTVGTARLQWTDASNNETSFQAQISNDAGTSWINVGRAVTRNATQSTATGAVLNFTVTVNDTTNALYRVQAINVGGATPSASVLLNDTVPPTAPTGFTITSFDTNPTRASARLAWVDTANNNSSYTVQTCLNTTVNLDCTDPTSVWTTLTTNLAGNATTYKTPRTLQRRISYSFRVTAVNSAGNASATLSAITR